MLDWLKELVIQGWTHIRPWFIIHAYESAGVLRFGRYHRKRGPGGIYWKIPFVEQVIEVTSCVTTLRLPAQYLTTKDGVSVAVASIVRYKIDDPEPYVRDIYDQHDVLADVTMGAVRRAIVEANYDDLLGALPEDKVATAVRRKANRYGFDIQEVTFTSFTRARPLMLISQQVFASLDN